MLQVIRNLGRRLNRKPAAVAGVGIDFECRQRGVRFHGRMGDFVGDEASFGYLVGVGKTFLGISEYVVVVLFEVVGLVVVDEVGLRLHRFLGIEVSGQELIIHLDQFEGLICSGFVDGGNTRNVVAHVTDFIQSERVFVVADGQNTIRIGRVFSDDHCDHPGQLLRAAGVNAFDTGVRVRRMQDSADEHTGQAQVVGVLAGAGGLAGGVDHGGGFSDDCVIAGH